MKARTTLTLNRDLLYLSRAIMKIENFNGFSKFADDLMRNRWNRFRAEHPQRGKEIERKLRNVRRNGKKEVAA